MIIKNKEEIRKYLPLSTGFVFESIRPFIQRAEKEILIPTISKELYDLLDNAYNDENTPLTSGRLFELLPYAQAVVVNFAVNEFIPVGSIQISSTGIKIHSEETLKPAPLWAKEELQEALTNAAFADAEALKMFLDENQDNYEEWTTSQSYIRAKESFINYASEFSDIYNIGNSNRTFSRLRSIIKNIEEDIIQNAIGSEYYEELREKYLDEDLNPDDKLVLRKIKKAIVFHSVAEAARLLPIQITEYGFSIRSYTGNLLNKHITPASDEQMLRFIETTKNKALEYVEEIRKYLNKTASANKYPTYFASSTYSSPEKEFKRIDTSENTKIYNTFS